MLIVQSLILSTWKPFSLSLNSASYGGGHVGTGGGMELIFCPEGTPIPSLADGISVKFYSLVQNVDFNYFIILY